MEHIFNEIVHIMHSDYAGFKDKLGWDNPKKFLTKLKKLKENNALTRENLAEIIKDYLLDFKDLHIHFYDNSSFDNKPMDRGFSVRRYNEYLYVTQVNQKIG